MPKKTKVRADVALKNMKDTKQGTTDLGGFSLGILIGGVTPIGILSAIPEIGNRMKVPVVSVSVPIRDWMPCSEDWGGIINVKRTYSKTIVIRASRRSNGNSSGDGVRTIFEEDEIDVTLNPRTAEEILQKAPKKPADVVGKGIHSDITTTIREADPCCGKDEGKWSTQVREGKIKNIRALPKEHLTSSAFSANAITVFRLAVSALVFQVRSGRSKKLTAIANSKKTKHLIKPKKARSVFRPN